MRLNRRSMLALGAAVPVLAGCDWLRPPVRRIVVLGEDVPGIRAIETVAEEVFPGNRVNFIIDPYEEMTAKANTDFAAQTGSYDIVLQYNAALANYVRNDYIVPIDEFEDSDWAAALGEHVYTNAWKEVGWYQRTTQEGPVGFGVPFSANSMVLCCNRAMFENADNRTRYERRFRRALAPPTTWEEFESIAQFFTGGDTRGVALQGAEYWNYYEWANLAFGSGGGVMRKEFGWMSDENTPLILASPQTVAATERYLRLKAYSQFGQSGADLFATDAGGQVQLMKTGRYAMALLWSDVAYGLVHAEMSWSDAYTFHVIPGSVSMLAGGSYYVNRRSQSKADAENIIKGLFEPERQKQLARLGLCPPRKDVYEDETLLTEVPYLRAVGESLQRGVYMLEAGLDADEIMAGMSRVLQEMFRSERSVNVATALASAQEEISRGRDRIFQSLRQ